MANFTNAEKATITQRVINDVKSKDSISDIVYSRSHLWTAAQAIRDLLDDSTFRTSVSDAIDTAISPQTMTNAQKKRLFGRVVEVMVGTEVA